MGENGKYYWLKLKRDFFKRHDIQIIEGMPNGKDYILFYLKLLCESVDHDGSLRFSEEIPYNDQMLATITNTNVDIVRSAVKLFIELRMMELMDDGTFYMTQVEKMIGGETKWAEKKRLQRAKGDNVPELSSNCPTEKDIEIRDKEIREEEEDKEKEIHSFNRSYAHEENISNKEAEYIEAKVEESGLYGKDAETYRAEVKERLKLRYMRGSLGQGVVFMSDEQFEDLCTKLGTDAVDKYCEIVAECEKSGKRYKKKSHYQAILDMAARDGVIKK